MSGSGSNAGKPLRRVLMIAYYFPPSVDVGAKRAEGFFRHLPEFGYHPIVLTVKDGNYCTVPGTAVEERSDVVRVTENWWPARVRTMLAGGGGHGPRPDRRIHGTVKRLFREIFYIPDGYCGFYRPACQAALEVLRRHAVDLIFTTSGPYTLLRVGSCLSRRTGVPWVADFRDLWLENQYGYPYSRARRLLDSFLQKRWLSSARRITTTTEGSKVCLQASGYASIPIDCVYNGYLESPPEPADDCDHEDKKALRVCFTGTLNEHPSHTVEPFFRTIDLLRNSRPEVFRCLRVHFYGIVNSDFGIQLERFRLHKVVRFHGLVPQTEAMRAQAASDVLLLLQPDSPEHERVVLSKTFDYMVARKPLLMIASKKGENARLLALARIGRVFSPMETADMAEYLSELMATKQQVGHLEPQGDLTVIETFAYRRLTSQLARIFEAAIQGGKRTPPS